MPRKRRAFSNLDKIKAIEAVKQFGTVYAASKEIGVNQVTLGKWVKDFKIIEAKAENETEGIAEALQVTGKILVSAKEVYEEHLKSYTEAAILVKKDGLKKMKDLIDKATKPEHLKYVTDAVRMLHETITPKEQEKNGGTDVDIFQTIVNQYGG
jgi:transposase-like protein